MSILRIGPDGYLLVAALIVSVVIAVLSWRRVGLAGASIVTLVAALAILVVQRSLESTNPAHPLVGASFVVVPSAILLGASRVAWLARRAWILLIVGPIVFVGCFAGLCYCAARVIGA